MRPIDADAMMKRLKAWDTNDATDKALYNFALDRVLEAPTIEERKTGKWLPDNNNYYEERFICSVCGRSYKVDTCMGKPMWDFCPCGAKMEVSNGRVV